MEDYFTLDKRLGIPVPVINVVWDDLSLETRQSILLNWETIRGKIPDHIFKLENTINIKQEELFEENDFAHSCRLNSEIAELASIINDLWLWFRTNQDITEKVHH
nr:hypothetical protein [uncultured Bacillus sp.]